MNRVTNTAIANRAFSDNPENAYTMPSAFYTDPAVYEQEKSAIFNNTWHYIGHESHFAKPGDYLTLEIADERIFVIKGDDDVIRGFYNVCRHRAHQLLKGQGNAKTIVCPYHAWSYKTDGKLRHARFGAEMPSFNPEEFCLPEIKVEMMLGLVFVNLDRHARSVSELTPGLSEDLLSLVPQMAKLKPLSTFAFDTPESSDWKANWKVVVDNYVECYHCHHAHPALADIMIMDSYEHRVEDQWARQLASKSRTENKAYAFSDSDDVQIAAYWYLWPTTSIWLVPGSANLFVLAMMPSSAGTTIFQGHRYGLSDEPDVERSTYLNGILGPEDQGLCESVQKGLHSTSYNQGRFMVDPARSGTAEHGVYQFHKLVIEALSDSEK